MSIVSVRYAVVRGPGSRTSRPVLDPRGVRVLRVEEEERSRRNRSDRFGARCWRALSHRVKGARRLSWRFRSCAVSVEVECSDSVGRREMPANIILPSIQLYIHFLSPVSWFASRELTSSNATVLASGACSRRIGTQCVAATSVGWRRSGGIVGVVKRKIYGHNTSNGFLPQCVVTRRWGRLPHATAYLSKSNPTSSHVSRTAAA